MSVMVFVCEVIRHDLFDRWFVDGKCLLISHVNKLSRNYPALRKLQYRFYCFESVYTSSEKYIRINMKLSISGKSTILLCCSLLSTFRIIPTILFPILGYMCNSVWAYFYVIEELFYIHHMTSLNNLKFWFIFPYLDLNPFL